MQIGTLGVDESCWRRLCELDARLERAAYVEVNDGCQGLLQRCAGLLLAGVSSDELARQAESAEIVRRFLTTKRPVLAFGDGAWVLNYALGGDCEPRPGDPVDETRRKPDDGPVRTTIFLTVGSKVAMTIGGSGWLTIRDVFLCPIPLWQVAQELMPSAITEDSKVAAFEAPGHGWTIGVAWDLTQSAKMPRGFGNILEAFVDRTVG